MINMQVFSDKCRNYSLKINTAPSLLTRVDKGDQAVRVYLETGMPPNVERSR